MNKRKILAILFSILTIGALVLTFKIFTSAEAGIENNRNTLKLLAVILTVPFLCLAIIFWTRWTKSKRH